ncbi:MAG: hypothetical protein V1865_02440 [bacterium]
MEDTMFNYSECPPACYEMSKNGFRFFFWSPILLVILIFAELIIRQYIELPDRLLQWFFIVFSIVLFLLSMLNFSERERLELLIKNKDAKKHNDDEHEKYWNEDLGQYSGYPNWHLYKDPSWILIFCLFINIIWFIYPYFLKLVFKL